MDKHLNDSWTDDQLIQSIRAGGQARNNAWQFIYKIWRPMYLKPILQAKGTSEQADEVMSKTIMDVQNQICRSDFALHSAKLSTYFIGCLIKKWAVAQKTTVSVVEYETVAPFLDAPTTSVEDDFIREERAALVRQALETLGDRCKSLLTMFGKSFKMEEIATEMGYANVQTAKNQVAICRDRVREILRGKI